MGYMDNLSQGYQNTYGGGYTQMYRKQPQTQIGGSQIKAPMRISLDRMYGGVPQGPPQAPPALQYNIPIPEDTYQPTAGYTDYDAYLELQGFELYQDPQTGTELWRPANATEGQVYTAPGGTPLIWEDNQWKLYSESRAAYETGTGGVSFDENYLMQGAITGTAHWTYYQAAQYGMGNFGEMYEWARTNMGESRDYGQWAWAMRQELIDVIANVNAADHVMGLSGANKEAYVQQLTDIANGLLSETQRLQNVEPTSENWQDQLNSLTEQLAAGEIDYLDENGNLDVTALIESGNIMGKWLADVLTTSFETGLIQSDFYDEEGNLVPELESMATYFESDPEAMEQWNRYNKELGMSAIARGQSMESAYYSETAANAVAGYGAQAADQVTKILQNEMKMQYEYIANSFKNVLTEMGRESEIEAFNIDMQNAYDEIMQTYDIGIQELADQIADGQSAQAGSIFSGIFSFIVNAAMMAF